MTQPIPVIDFESFSEVDLGDVGAWNYTRHPSTEILCMSYDMRDGCGPMLWIPGWPAPQKLLTHVDAGGLVEAASSFFEYTMWTNHCVPRLGWPALRLEQMRDVAAHARAWSLPGRLEYAAKAAGCTKLKDEGGHRVMLKLCKPRKPTKNNPDTRHTPASAPDDFNRLYSYCIGDVESEVDLGERVPQLSPTELNLWLVDQRVNARGIYLDGELTENCLSILAQMTKRYTAELQQVTGGAVNTASEVAAMLKWLISYYGVKLPDLTADTVKAALKRDDLPPAARRVLEIRKALASSSVKKLFAMRDMRADDGRARGLFKYCGATRTGRWGGADIQTQNLTKAGPPVRKCPACGLIQWSGLATCRRCATPVGEEHEADWGIEAMELAISDITSRDLDRIITCWGDPLKTLSGVLRGILRAAPGYEIVCGDYSAIEAVVIAALAGEEWRLDVFRTHGKIYEMSASKICGIPFEDFLEYKKANGRHHPMRNKIGKFAELACLGGDTPILTRTGWKRLDALLPEDEVYDGDEYVAHDGLVFKGYQSCLGIGGVSATPDHKFLGLSEEWHTALTLWQNPWALADALDLRDYPGDPERSPLCPKNPSRYHTAPVFDIANCGPQNRFMILTDQGPLIAHNCGFGGGLNGMKKFGADKFLSDAEITDSVKKWRDASPEIVNLWYRVEDCAHNAVAHPGQVFAYRDIAYQMGGDVLYCRLPSGRCLSYHQPRLTQIDKWGNGRLSWELSFMGVDQKTHQWVRQSTYSGRLVENCFSSRTQVVTRGRLKAIEDITPDDEVWDGESWVKTGGAICQGRREVGVWAGIRVTPSHLILVGNSWKSVIDLTERTASAALSLGRASAPLSYWWLTLKQKARSSVSAIAGVCTKPKRAPCAGKNNLVAATAPIKPGGVTGKSATGMPPLSPTKRSADHGATDIPGSSPAATTPIAARTLTTEGGESECTGSGWPTARSFWHTLPRFLIGTWKGLISTASTTTDTTNPEISVLSPGVKTPETSATGGKSRFLGLKWISWTFGRITALAGRARTASRTTSAKADHTKKLWKSTGERTLVYDIMNAGPNRRFMIVTDLGPVIVHNCVQATARDLIAHALPELEAAGYLPVLHAHDEIGCEVPEGWGSVEELCAIMSDVPEWARGWPVKAAGWRGVRYRKD